MWKGRFEEDTALVVQRFSQSLDLDWRMAEQDIRGSIAHVRMLGAVGLLEAGEALRVEEGLKRVRDEIRSGSFTPSEPLEDVHMNVEHRLTEIEPSGARLHTGRSRNDQTATTVRLYLRDRLTDLEGALLDFLGVLLDCARLDDLPRIIVAGGLA